MISILDDIREGDFIANGGMAHKILGICGQVFFVSAPYDYEEYWRAYSIAQLNRLNYEKVS